MLNKLHVTLMASALVASPALAQTAEPAAPASPAPQAAPAAPAPVTPVEVKQFAKAAIAADKVNKDTSIPAAEKPQQLAAAVSGAGLEPERFNQIAEATQTDPAIQQQVQAAIMAEQQAQPSATAPAPSSPTQ